MRFLLKQYRAIFSSMNIYFAIPPPPPFFFWPITSKFHSLFLFCLNALGWKAGTKSIFFTTNLFCPLSVQFLSKKQLFSGPNEYHTIYLYIVFSLPPPLLLSCDVSTSSISSAGVIFPFRSFLYPSCLLFVFLLSFGFISPDPKSNSS